MKYYFHLHDDVATFDREGRELSGLEAALGHATVEARIMAADWVRRGALNLSHRIEITDETGVLVGIIAFKDVINITSV